jgi:hypothetical protein
MRTKAQLEELGYPRIGIQLKDGSRLFGKVTKFTDYTIYFKDKNGDELDVPRRIISRAFLCLDGGKDEPTRLSKENKPGRGTKA